MSTGGSSNTGGAADTGGSANAGGSTNTGGASEGSGGSNGADQFPATTDIAGIEAFLAAESYKSWVHDPAPRGPTVTFATHSAQMQVYFNDIAVANHADVTMGGMLVKELYNDAGDLIGKAASLKATSENELWTFYCKTDDEAAGCQTTGAQPLYFVDEFITGCASCHGDEVLTPLP